jgi:uncharacterized protein
MDRRKFFKIAGMTALGSVTAVGVYPFLEAKWCCLARHTITLPNLPPAFRGMTLALISDVHHGPFVPLAYVKDIVEIANSLKPDLVLLTGDYVSRHPRYIEPAIEALGNLKARIGRFAVLGNHDHWESAPVTRQALTEAGINLTARSICAVWFKGHTARFSSPGAWVLSALLYAFSADRKSSRSP